MKSFRLQVREETSMEEHKSKKCLLCGKPSVKSICPACADQVQSEALNKKKKLEKKK